MSPGIGAARFPLDEIAGTPKSTGNARLKVIEAALRVAVPYFEALRYKHSMVSGPRLEVRQSNWPAGAVQDDRQLSDGTLRFIGMMWALLDGNSLLLIDEPELSLNTGVVSQLAPLFYRIQDHAGRQVIVSTHSEALLSEAGIDGREVLMLKPDEDGTSVTVASDIQAVKVLLESGFTVGEVVMPRNTSGSTSGLWSLEVSP